MADGARVEGMCQVACFCKPSELDHDAWLATWQGSHTATAIETQSTFAYRQNLVVRRLTEDTPPCHAIVEENFPAAAMTSDEAFYEAEGDPDKYQANLKAMIDSVMRFIDFESMERLPFSEYNF